MTFEDFADLRRSLGLRQSDWARALGMSLRSLQEIESGERTLKVLHRLAAERAAMKVSAERGDPMLSPACVRRDAMKIVADLQA